MWILYALLAALAGAILAVLTKSALREVDHSVALAVQSVPSLIISWGSVILRGKVSAFSTIDRNVWLCLLVSGVVTGGSYLLLFRALEQGDVARVVPLDRLSLVFAIVLGAIFLKEQVNAAVILGGLLMAAGALVIAVAKN